MANHNLETMVAMEETMLKGSDMPCAGAWPVEPARHEGIAVGAVEGVRYGRNEPAS